MAARLRAELRDAPMPAGDCDDPAMKALRVLGEACRGGSKKTKKTPSADRILKNPELSALLAPFLGDPGMGRWPFQDPHRIDDEEAQRWLSVVARVPVPAEGVTEFAWMMFHARPRSLWVPASEALVALAGADDATRGRLQALWSECFPKGLPRKWRDDPEGKTTGGGALESFGGRAHAQRHLLNAACGLLARGLDVAGFTGLVAADICAMGLKGDAADASAFLLALRQLLKSEATRALVLEHILPRARELRPDPQCDEALCELIGDLREGVPSTRALQVSLIEHVGRPRWREGSGLKEQADVLWSWLDVIERLQQRGEATAVDAARREAGPALRALTWRLEGAERPDGTVAPVASAVELLRHVRDPHLRATEPSSSMAVALVELLVLLARKDFAQLPWPSLVARAGGDASAAVPGTVAEAARAELLLTLAQDAAGAVGAHAAAPPAILLRDATLSREAAVELAASQNGFVAAQVAIQVERLLRESPDEVQRIRLLWSVLRRDPPRRFFTELRAMLRGSGTHLHGVVEAMQKLDESRASKTNGKAARAAKPPCSAGANEAGPGLVRQLDASIGAYQRSLELLEASPDSASEEARAARRALSSLLGSLRTLRDMYPPDGERSMPERWREGYRQALLGEKDTGGVGDWLKWAGFESADLERLCQRFQSALEAIETAPLTARLDRCHDLRAESNVLAEQVERLAWPEQVIADLIGQDVEQYIAQRTEEARRAGIEAERLRRAILEGDEEKALAFVTEEQVNLLPQEELKRLSAFLLSHLRLREAHRLRAMAQRRAAGAEPVQLPAVWTYLAPLFVGVSSGPLLVLDVGEAFVKVSRPAPYTITVTLTFGLAFVLLAADFLSRMAVARRDRPALERIGRILLLYLTAACLAGAVSFVVLRVIEQPSDLAEGWQLLTWTGLSLFFGIFLGLVMQGRRMATEVEHR